MTEYGDLIASSFGRSNPVLPPVVGNIDEDPKKAQRAMELSKAMGVPGSIIHGDLEEFERQNKAAMASALVANNPHLQDFVASDPMIPKLANDSYGNLDALSEKLDDLGLVRNFFERARRDIQHGFMKGYGEADLGQWAVSSESGREYPETARALGAVLSPVELALRAVPGAVTALSSGFLGAEKGEQLAEVALDPGLQATLMGIGPAGAVVGGGLELVGKLRGPMTYLKNGREPPPGVVPEVDKLRIEQNADDLKKLKDSVQEAQSSPLWERNPDLVKQFIKMKGDAEIGVSGEAVAALYGDKLPEVDDNLLGWVPGIAEKLELARETGADVRIPLADWLANVDPKVMDALKEDIRVRPNGITVREATKAAEVEAVAPYTPTETTRQLGENEPWENVVAYQKAAREAEDANQRRVAMGDPQVATPVKWVPPLPTGPLPGEVPTVRAANALEPMFSVGDRKLALQRMPGPTSSQFGPEQGFHSFAINDEKGTTVGAINLSEQKGGKQLFVEMIQGLNGLGPRDFGPALMRSLLVQLKAEFPNVESITGHRVSGAREKLGTWEAKSAQPVVKLDNPDIDAFRQALEGGQWESFTPNMRAYIKPDALRSLDDRHLISRIRDELDRIVSQKVYVQPADRIVAERTAGQGVGTIEPGGSYIRFRDMYPIILFALEKGDPLGTARHEAIHHLRNYGFFTSEEWSILEAASQEHDWIKRFRIDERYSKGDRALKLEESIADAYKHWKAGAMAPPELHGIFEKMKAFFARVHQLIAQHLGKADPTWEDIFKKVDTGEVGGREGAEPLEAGVFNEKLSVAEEGGSRNAERAAALGVSKDTFKKYDAAVAEEQAADVAAATKRAQEEQGRKQTKEWKDNRKALRQEVAGDIKGRPDVAADLFFGAGELYGKKVPLTSVKLDESVLTSEQKAALPRQYWGAKGLHPDEVANLFGYGSGQAMLDHLVAYNQAKLTAGMSARDFVSRITDIETDRQMQLRHGDLEKNIIDAVNEQVTGEVAQDRLHAQLNLMREQLGMAPEDELTKAAVRQKLKDKFAQMPLGSVSSEAYLRAAGRIGHQVESGLLDAKSHEAFAARLQQYYATVIANEAAKLEKDLVKFDKVAKRASAREMTGVDQEYTNFIHDILLRVGRPVRRSIQDLGTEIAAGEYKDLQSFVEGKQGFYLREVAVADMLFDSAFRKKFEDLTVDEFRAVDTSIKSLIANGRAERKLTKAGEAADLAVVKDQMIDQLAQFQERTYDAKGGRWMGPIPSRMAKVLRTYGAAHIQMENLFNRWDHDNPRGVFQQYVMRDLVDAANSESAMEKRYAEKLRGIDDKADLKAKVDNPLFKVPGTEQLMQLNRGNLRAILLNVGNDSNLSKLARGYKVPKEQVMAWVHQHATKEDWDWAQKMGDIFKEIKDEADTMYRGLSGVAPESIPLEPIATPHGQYAGWYYPLIAHPEFEGPTKKMMGQNALEQEGFVRATTANGYTKARTGVAYPLALDLDMLPPRMKQMIHDISMRPAIINASKIFYDKDVRSAIFTRFGAEWRDMLVPYLVDVANSANYMPKDQRILASAGEFLRQNLISTLVGLNPGTVLKHGPTALAQSLHEVGPVEFLKAMKSLFSINDRTGDTNWSFAMSTSEELQRRHQNYVETLGGATDLLQPSSGYGKLRNAVQRFAATPVALSDLLSAVPTWLAQYEKTIGEGATHGDAVYMADRSVRRAHGSVAITNRSGVMRGGALSQWFASVYGFFNHIMNRQYELLWKSGETLGMVKDGDYHAAMQRAPELTSMMFAYVVAPALIEEMVTPLMSQDGDSWGKKAAKGLAFTLGASWIGVRDIANALLNGRDPSVGLISTEAKTITDFARDLGKQGPFSKEHAGKVVRDGATLLGGLSGVVPAQVGRAAQFGYGAQAGTERPKGPWGWMTGARYGTLKGHPATFDEWQRHHLGGRR
jgi:hypothetical protein